VIPAVRVKDGVWVAFEGEAFFVPDPATARAAGVKPVSASDPVSPMPGRVVKVFVEAGAAVKGGDPLAAVEAMKMEYLVRSPGDGKVGRVLCAEGQAVVLGQKLLDWEPAQ
jgi:biotin carboxyl carrier protein